MSARDLSVLRSLADRIDPQDAGAHNNLGVVFFQKGLVEDAVKAFEHALELDPRLDVARTNVRIAYERTSYFRRRVAELRERVAEEPGDDAARDALARTSLLGGDPDTAAREWRVLLEDHADDLELHMKVAFAELERGRIREAERLLGRAVALAPEEPAVHRQLAEVKQRSGDRIGALACARRAVELAREDAGGYVLLGDILQDLGHDTDAAAARQRAMELEPGIAEAEHHLSLERYFSIDAARTVREPESVEGRFGHYARAADLRRKGDLEGALRELERSVAEGEDEVEVREAMAELRLIRGDLAEAVALYDRLLEERPDSPKLWNERAVAVHRSGDLARATEGYRRAVALDHAYGLGWNNLAVVRTQEGDSGAAERAFRKAAEADPPAEVLWNLGLFLTHEKRLEEAVEVCRSAADADEEIAESWTRLGAALFQAGRHAEARDALLRSLDLDPDGAEARYQLGFVLSALGDFPGALRETKRALELDPLFPAPRYRLLIDVQFESGSLPAPDEGALQVRPGSPVDEFEPEPEALDRAFAGLALPRSERPAEFGEALEEARLALRRGKAKQAAEIAGRALAVAPEAVEALLLQAAAQLQLGLAGEALERFEAVLDAGAAEHMAAARRGRARCLLLLGRPGEAAAAVDAAVGPEDLAVRGRALLAAGDAGEAVAAFEDALRGGLSDVPLLTGLGEALLAQGRPADAEPVFRRALAAEPAAVAARVGLGNALAALGDLSGAEEAYRDAATALPSYAEAVLRLAEVRWRDGRRPAALRGIVELLQLDPTHAEALVRLGTWLYELGRTDQAIRAVRRALSFDPGNQAARSELDRMEGEVADAD